MSRRLLFFALALFFFSARKAGANENGVFFSSVRISMELREDAVSVKELLTVKPIEKQGFPNTNGLATALPRGAFNAGLVPNSAADNLTLSTDAVMLTEEIPEAGRQIAVMFMLPIKDGKAVLDQSLDAPVELAHAALIGDANASALKGAGFGKSRFGKTSSDRPALFIVGRNIEDGRLLITVDNMKADLLDIFTVFATVLSFLVLTFGFVLWIQRRIAKDADFV